MVLPITTEYMESGDDSEESLRLVSVTKEGHNAFTWHRKLKSPPKDQKIHKRAYSLESLPSFTTKS